ncbi:MAG: BTAD domain-containing putative transcriptional regulator [Anaerolineales bacterium]
MPRLEIALLGHPLIKIDGNLMDADRRKATALLAYLAVTGGTYTREQLATLLWPDYERENAFAYLRRTLWEINQALGKNWILADRDQIGFNKASDFWLDTAAFTGLLTQYETSAQPQGGMPFLETAIALYREDFLFGFSVPDSAEFEEWQFFQVEAFRQQFTRALEKLINAYEQSGNPASALPYARRWLQLDALYEPAHQALMRLYARLGDRSASVRQYEACVQILKKELDVPPQPETTALYEQIVRGKFLEESITRLEPQKVGERVISIRLPVQSTAFIGRRMELEQAKSLILSPFCRLLTLLGPGGAGKTRLSMQIGQECAGVFSEGVFFVPLDTLTPGDMMVSAIAKTLDFYFYMGEERPRQQLLDYFRGKRILLILDNFEHLLDAENLEFVSALLATSPETKIVTTSRSRLGLQGEYVFTVTGLEIPDAKNLPPQASISEDYVKLFSGLELFVTRARRVVPGFHLTRENLPAVIQICHLVEGMPLGIELASAWLELLPPQEIAQEISRNLDFLATSLKDIPVRQRSLRAIFESSWKYLDETEREVFQKLSVFQGGFSREAAHIISGTSLQTLLGLVNKSWLQVDARSLTTQEGRLQVHDLLRQYANELLKTNLPEWSAVKDLHATYYSNFAELQGTAMRGKRQLEAINAMAAEFETNLRVAWLWLVERQNFEAITQQMLPGLFHFCLIRSLCPELIPLVKQARQAVEKSLTQENQRYWAILMTAEIYMEIRYNILEDMPREKLSRTWGIMKHRTSDMGGWFVFLARDYAYEIAYPEGYQHLQSHISQIRTRVQLGLEDAWVLGWCLMFLGRMNIKGKASEESFTYLNEALKIFQSIGVYYEKALTLLSLGDATWRQKKAVVESVNYFQMACELFERVDDPFGVATIWRVLGEIYLQAKDFDKAFRAFKEQGMVYERIGNRPPPSGSGTFFGSRELG